MARERKCPVCNKVPENPVQFLCATKGANNSKAWMCSKHIHLYEYGTKPTLDKTGTDSKSGFLWGLEWELNFVPGISEKETLATVVHALGEGTIATEDCTVDAEVLSPMRGKLCGLRDIAERIAQVADMRADNVGLHFNASTTITRNSEYAAVMAARDIMSYILDNYRDELIKVCGRNFGDWCRDDKRFQHGSFCNIDDRYGFRLELRLNHFDNVAQLMRSTYWVRFLLEKCLDPVCTGELPLTTAIRRASRELVKVANGESIVDKRAHKVRKA